MKKMLSLLLVLSMLFSMVPMAVFAAEVPTISVASAEVDAGGEVVVEVSISENSGFTNFDFQVTYGDNLTLKKIGQGSLLQNYNTEYEDLVWSQNTNTGKFSCVAASGISDNGVVAKLTFTAGENSGNNTVSISMNDTASAAMKNGETVIEPAFVPGAITVGSSTPTAVYTASIEASSNSVTVDEEVEITVDVGGTANAYSAAQVVVEYDATYLTFNQGNSTLNDAAVKAENGTITIVDHGEASDNDDDYVLNFTAAQATNDAGTAVTLESAAFSPEADAKSEDLTPAERDTTTKNIVINNKVYTVTLTDGFEGEETVEHGTIYTFTADETGVYYKDYSVTVKDAQGNTVTGVTVDGDATNGWLVTGITQNVTIEVTRTPLSYTVTWAGVYTEGVASGSDKTEATYGTDFIFTLNAGEAPTDTQDGYHYKAVVTRADEDITPTPSDRTYTIAGTAITDNLIITVSKVIDEADNVIFNMTGKDITAKDEEDSIVIDGATIEKGTDITLVLDPQPGYDYTITVKQGDGEATDVTDQFVDNEYTIENVKTAVTVTVTKTLKIGTPKVELYLTADGLNIWLLTAGEEQIPGKVLTYDGGEMYWSSKYQAYAYLIIEKTLTDDIDTEKFAITESTKAVRYDMNVNGSTDIDANDAQLIWNMYNARYNDFTVVDMGKFLEADVAETTTANLSAKVNMDDAAAIVDAILKSANG